MRWRQWPASAFSEKSKKRTQKDTIAFLGQWGAAKLIW